MELTNLTQMFIQARRADGVAERTSQDYQRVLFPFAAWCERKKIDLSRLSRTAVRQYVCGLRSRQWKQSTVAIYIRVFRTFLRWLHTEELMAENLALVIKPESSETRLEDLPTEQELLRLIEACGGDLQAPRDRAMILTMLDTGLRLGEMVLLHRDQLHLDPDGKTLWMLVETPKTKSQHFAYLGEETTRAIQLYLESRQDDWPELWVGQRGALTTLGIYRAVRRRADKAELDPKRVHPHAFRKLFATFWMDNGGDVISLKRVGGWKTTSVVEDYIMLTGRKKLGQIHRRFSPTDGLMQNKGEDEET